MELELIQFIAPWRCESVRSVFIAKNERPPTVPGDMYGEFLKRTHTPI